MEQYLRALRRVDAAAIVLSSPSLGSPPPSVHFDFDGVGGTNQTYLSAGSGALSFAAAPSSSSSSSSRKVGIGASSAASTSAQSDARIESLEGELRATSQALDDARCELTLVGDDASILRASLASSQEEAKESAKRLAQLERQAA